MMSTYLIYTPVAGKRKSPQYGGPMCIKTNSVQAYLGFATENLARQFCKKMRIGSPTQIIEATEIGPKFPSLLPDVHFAVRISDSAVLDTYFANPATFPCEQYLVDIQNDGNAA